jgi:hypothetical protein
MKQMIDERRAWADVGPSFEGREFDDTALVAAASNRICALG